jgi:hypothetical protein
MHTYAPTTMWSFSISSRMRSYGQHFDPYPANDWHIFWETDILSKLIHGKRLFSVETYTQVVTCPLQVWIPEGYAGQVI